MAKKGIALITGPKSIKLGETALYRVSKVYRKEDEEKISQAKWKLYVREQSGFRELKPVAGTPPKIGKQTSITITNQNLLGKELLLEAYLYAPEKSSPPGILMKVEEGNKKIERIDLFRTDDTPIAKGGIVKYGQSIIVKVITLNMPYQKVKITLYEDDEAGSGHNPNNEKNKVTSVTKYLDKDGFTMHTFNLPIDFKKIANAYKDGTSDKYHEYYICVKALLDTKTSDNLQIPNPDYIFPEQQIKEVIIPIKAKEIGTNPLPNTGRSASKVYTKKENEKNENIKHSLEKGTWNVIITEKYTGKKCTHIENKPARNNCRRGKIEVYDHNSKIVLMIKDCLLEGVAGENRMKKKCGYSIW